MNNMIERVARAMWAERCRHAKAHAGIDLEAYDELFGGAKVAELNNILGESRAAIEAMREETNSGDDE